MKEVGWISELFRRPFSGEDGQILFITTADKTGNDLTSTEVAPSLSFQVVARSVSSFLVHSWEELISAIAFMMNSLENVKANPNVV